MHQPKRWNIAPSDPAAPELAERLKTSPLLAQVLLNRGLRDVPQCQTFLRPSPRDLHDPALVPGLAAAAARLAKAIGDREKIVIYGDYDVDGITATAILYHAIGALGGSANYYVPHRIEEGYGLSNQAIAQICAEGAKLIVTVDCGVTAIEPARVAREQGVDLIITDHHEWKTAEAGQPLLPDAYAIVHPRLNGTGAGPGLPYPNAHLCGAGVALKLAWGLGQAISGTARVSDAYRQFLVEATSLAALGTIADVVPLLGENRILAHWGLGGLAASSLVGIRALIASAGLTGRTLDSYHVGFSLAPRLNAAGRMGHANLAVELLTVANESRAAEIAAYIEQQNRQRQALERKILAAALEQAHAQAMDQDDARAIVLGAEGWHPGVIGIVAGRLVDRLHRPAIMIAMTNGHGQGSGRSIAGFHLTRALDACKEFLDTFGGHEMAAGLKLQTARFPEFREAFCHYARASVTPEMMVPELTLEAEAHLRQITAPLVQDLDRLGPFGMSNRRPLLACRGLELAGPPRHVGKSGDHLQLFVRQGDATMKCIAFGFGPLSEQLPAGRRVDLAVEPTLNNYNGYTNVELEVKDIHFCD